MHRKSKNQKSKNIARILNHKTCELCFSKCKFFHLRKDIRFFAHQIFLSMIFDEHYKRDLIINFSSQNVFTMSATTAWSLWSMKYMVFSLGVVLIMFSCKKLVKHVFNTKNRIFTCSGGTPAFFSIYDFFMLILKAVGPGYWQ